MHRQFGNALLARYICGISNSHFVASVWLLGKYGTEREIKDFLSFTRPRWCTELWLSRQATCLSLRVNSDPGIRQYVTAENFKAGHLKANQIYAAIDNLMAKPTMDSSTKGYLLHGNAHLDHYPVGKFIILSKYLRTSQTPIDTRQSLVSNLIGRVTDPIFRRGIEMAIDQ